MTHITPSDITNFAQIRVLELKDYLKNKIMDNGYSLITNDTYPYQKISVIYIYIYRSNYWNLKSMKFKKP